MVATVAKARMEGGNDGNVAKRISRPDKRHRQRKNSSYVEALDLMGLGMTQVEWSELSTWCERSESSSEPRPHALAGSEVGVCDASSRFFERNYIHDDAYLVNWLYAHRCTLEDDPWMQEGHFAKTAEIHDQGG